MPLVDGGLDTEVGPPPVELEGTPGVVDSDGEVVVIVMVDEVGVDIVVIVIVDGAVGAGVGADPVPTEIDRGDKRLDRGSSICTPIREGT